MVQGSILLTGAVLETPVNREAPIAAALSMEAASGAPIEAVFDFRQTGPQTWDITFQTDEGVLVLSEGGNKLAIDGAPQAADAEGEYPAMYRRFVDLVRAAKSDVDLAPLRLVADAFLRGQYRQTEAFED